MLRSILHCDMNNFYASVECMLDPALKKYPIAVCGSVEERHGIVLAKNYKAKAFDVKTGDAVWQAKQKCKDLVVVPPHYEEYEGDEEESCCPGVHRHGGKQQCGAGCEDLSAW